MNCKLKVFKQEVEDRNSGRAYRFAVLDYNKSNSYPANFVCMLPIKISQSQQKEKSTGVFGQLFGDKSLDLALGLLNDALKTEHDVKVKAEIERRIKLLDPKSVNLVRCSICKKSFQPLTSGWHRQKFCTECLNKRYGPRP